MSSEWKTVSIDEIKAANPGSIAIDPFGSRMKSDCYVDAGVRVVRGTNLTGGSSFSGDFVFITSEKARELNSANLSSNDLVFPHRGAIGEVGIVPNDGEQYVLSSSLMKLTCDLSRVHPHFIYYFFKSEAGRFELLKNSSQVGTPGIGQPLTSLKQIKLKLPPIGEQELIVATLRTLDDRITLLRETNATLEAIAQALFKSWFVDFDPVRAKQEGRAPEGMDDATAALFPDSFEESELGLVPKGWRVAKFGDFISRLSVGKKFDQKTALSDGNVPILDQGKSGVIGFHNEAPGVVASLDDPVVVFANHTCYMRLIPFPFSAIQNVLPFKGNGVDTVWAFYATKDRVKFSEYKGHWPDFAIEKTSLPDGPLTDHFRNAIDPLIRRMHANELQAQTLATLRDTLLPRLISGQLRLPEVEAMIERVT